MTPIASEENPTRAELGLAIYSLKELRTYLAYYADDPAIGRLALTWLTEALNPARVMLPLPSSRRGPARHVLQRCNRA